MAGGFGGTIKLTGENEYKSALQSITQSLRVVSSEMKAASSSFENGGKSIKELSTDSEKLKKSLDQQKTALSALKSKLSEMQNEYNKTATNHKKLVESYKTETSKLEEIKKTLGESSDEYKKQEKVVENLSSEVEKSQKSYDAQGKALNDMKIKTANAETQANKTEKALNDLGNAAEDSGEKAEGAGNGGFTVLKGALANLVSDGISRAIDGVKSLAQSTFEAGSNFEASMSNVQAISGATGDEMIELKDKAEEMGAKTKFTATEAGDAMGYMAMAGWKTSDMLNGIEGIMNLAAASGEDLATTSDIVTDALTAMGYSAGDAGELADVMAAASSNANTNVSLMGQTFQYAAPIVGALGYNMQDTAVAIGLMANAGIKGEKSGTALRSILTRLSAPPKECATAMDELGISLTNSDGTIKSLSEVMDELRSAFSGLSETQQTQYAKSIAGQEAMSGLLAIVNASPADYDKLTEAVKNCSGASEEMANTMNDNVSGQITLLKSKIEGIMIKIFDNASSSIRDAISKISDTLDSIDWDKVADSIGQLAEKIADAFGFILDHGNEIVGAITAIVTGFAAFKTAGAITAVITDFKTFFSVLKTGQGVMAALNAVMAANPIGLIVTAIAAAVAAFVYFWNTSESFRNFWKGLWTDIQNIVSTVVNAIVGFFTDTIPSAFSSFVGFVQNIGDTIKDFFTGIASTVTDFAVNAFTSFIDTVQSLPSTVSTFLGNVISAIGVWAVSMGQKALEAGQTFLSNIVTFFQQLPERIGYFIGYALGTIVKFAIELPSKAQEAGSNFLNAIVSFFTQLPGTVSNFLSNVISNVSSWASNMAAKAREAGSNFISNVVSFFTQLPGRVSSFLSSVISNVASWASSMASKARQAGSNFLNNTVSAIRSLPGNIASILSSVISRIGSFVSQMASNGARAASSFGNSILSGLRSIPSQVGSIGSQIVHGIWAGISGAAGWLAGQVKSFARGILDGMKAALGIHSPSRVFRDEVGKYIAQGVGVGFEDEMKNVSVDMQNAIPTDFNVDTSYNTGYNTNGAMSGFDTLVTAFKTALSEMKIVMDDEEMGKFVDKTVTKLVYNY